MSNYDDCSEIEVANLDQQEQILSKCRKSEAIVVNGASNSLGAAKKTLHWQNQN